MICKAESETIAIPPSWSFCHPELALSLPHLPGYALCSGKLWVLQSCTHLWWWAAWNSSHWRWDFMPWASRMGYQRNEDSEFHPLKSHSEKSHLRPNLFPGDGAAQRAAASSETTGFLEQADGNGQIPFPGGFIWSSKVSEFLWRFYPPTCDQAVTPTFHGRKGQHGCDTWINNWSDWFAKCRQQDLATKVISDKFEEFYSTNACYCFSQNVTKLTIIFTLSAKMWTVYLNILKRIKKTFHKKHLLPYESLSAVNAHTSI